MSTIAEALAPAAAAGPRTTRPIVRPWRALLIPTGTLALGVIAGVALTYLTVIIPRTQELHRSHGESSFLRTFRAESLFEVPGLPTTKFVVTNSGSDKGVGDERVRVRTFEGRCKVPAASQPALFGGLQTRLIQVVNRAGSYVWNQGTSTTAGANGRREHYTVGYNIHGVVGVIHVWATSQGDEVDLIVSVHEF